MGLAPFFLFFFSLYEKMEFICDIESRAYHKIAARRRMEKLNNSSGFFFPLCDVHFSNFFFLVEG
jgi:hypothetical protein